MAESAVAIGDGIAIGAAVRAGAVAADVLADEAAARGALAPVLAGGLLSVPALLSVPFFLAGGLKILYDLLLLRSFRQFRPPEEVAHP